MTVDNPKFHEVTGQVVGCFDCPFDADTALPCKAWWYRNGDTCSLVCPTKETYQEACEMAEKETTHAEG